MTPHSVVVTALLAATAVLAIVIATQPARGQSDQWATMVVAAKPYAKPVRKAPRFYIKRNKKPKVHRETRRVRSVVPVRQGPRAVSSSLPASRAVSMNESFAMLPLHTTMVRTVSVSPPPFSGAFHVRTPPPVDVPSPPIVPDPTPMRDTAQFKAMVAGGFAALFFVTIFYASKGGINGQART